jgi:hypothetical protein
MKNTFSKSALLLLLLLAAVPLGFGGGKALVIGSGPVTTDAQWAGYSALNLISGTSIMTVKTSTTALYVQFTQGAQADISNMVLYTTTGRANPTIASVTPVTLGGISNPTIVLTNKKVCKHQPVSVTNPCTVRLDLLKLVLSPMNDYWLVMYFASDSNNANLGGAIPVFRGGPLTGFYLGGDETTLTPGQSIPSGNTGLPNFLVAVQTQ